MKKCYETVIKNVTYIYRKTYPIWNAPGNNFHVGIDELSDCMTGENGKLGMKFYFRIHNETDYTGVW